MCGIAGFINNGSEDVIYNMIASINYRGPDHLGVSLIDQIGLGQARLSIIDLDDRSNQPFFTEDKQKALVFNGEIYNYLAIKDKLLKTGKYTFRTTSDTEVLLYAYVEYGADCLQHITGMFAFAVYDYQKKEMFLARDRMGKKPLYYTFQNNSFVFASELKAVLRHPAVEKQLNYTALNQYLTFDYVPSPNSIIQDVHKLEAAQYMIVRGCELVVKKHYWNITFGESNISYSEAMHRFDHLLDAAVKKRLMSDVPLGVFLSGGVDSSSVAYYAQKHSTSKVKTFSIGFNEKSYDESSYARQVAEKLGTEHYEDILSAEQSLNLLEEVTENMDEPFADPSIIPTYFLSKFTKQHVTVALGGDGSDELLAGYPTFISERVAGVFNTLPKPLVALMDKCAGFLPVSDKNISFDFKVKQFLKGFQSSKTHIHPLWLSSFTPKDKLNLFNDSVLASLQGDTGLECVDYYYDYFKNEKHFNQLLYVYFKTYLQDDILVKVDRASMYNSLEVRVPFLDTDLVEFLNTLPQKYKIRGNNVKRLLKDLMIDKLPEDIIKRPKKGFGIPVSKWIREDLKPLTDDLLSESNIIGQGIFNYEFIKKLRQEHASLKHNHRKLIWNLLVLQMYLNKLG